MEALLRDGSDGCFGHVMYPHSALSQRLRMDVLESKHFLDARLAYTVAVAALHANSDADVSKGSDMAWDLYQRALGSLPYYAAAKAAEKPEDERDAAVQKWRRLQEQELTEKSK